jgi:tryptophanyl-tRNA synthetase
MSASSNDMCINIDPNSAVFLTDSPAQIKNKINRHAFSGGGDTSESHKINGGNCDVDISYQYLRFFMDDDVELERIGNEYKSGSMSTGELKKICIQVVTDIVVKVQNVFVLQLIIGS